MATQATPSTQVPAGYDAYAEDDERGYGWVMFAGVLLLLLGTINFIVGLAAIGNAHFFTANAPLDILAIYGLITYGRRISSAD